MLDLTWTSLKFIDVQKLEVLLQHMFDDSNEVQNEEFVSASRAGSRVASTHEDDGIRVELVNDTIRSDTSSTV